MHFEFAYWYSLFPSFFASVGALLKRDHFKQFLNKEILSA